MTGDSTFGRAKKNWDLYWSWLPFLKPRPSESNIEGGRSRGLFLASREYNGPCGITTLQAFIKISGA